MKISTTYTCEYCGRMYDAQIDCEKCEAEHNNVDYTLLKIKSALKDSDVYYSYKPDVGVIFIYKITNVYVYDGDLYIEYDMLELYINRIFNWIYTSSNDRYRGAYFLDDIAYNNWKILKEGKDEYAFNEIEKIIYTKSKEEKEILKDPIMTKYNTARTHLRGISTPLELFESLFEDRSNLDLSIQLAEAVKNSTNELEEAKESKDEN